MPECWSHLTDAEQAMFVESNDHEELRDDDSVIARHQKYIYPSYRLPLILPSAEGLLTVRPRWARNIDEEAYQEILRQRDFINNPIPIYAYKISCGCGYYDTYSLADWDSHLAELVASDDGNIKMHTDRTSVIMVRIE